MPDKIVFTVGHSRHEIEDFIALLGQHGVSCLIDVRSSPYSRIAPQFNRETLSATLKQNEILYAHFEKEFGARHTDPALLDEDGKVDFDKVRESPEFKQGVQRLNNALELGYTVALMCSEADPFDCHRFSMISYQLVKEGLHVHHILKDGQIVDNSELEKRLLEKHQRKLPQSTLFETVTREMQIEAAYRLRGKQVAFSALKPEEDPTDSEDASHD